MSRIGKKPISLPKGVDVKVDGTTVSVKGPKGQLSQQIHSELKVEVGSGAPCSASRSVDFINSVSRRSFWKT